MNFEGYTFIEQNSGKDSKWGEKARQGHNTMWICRGPKYIAQIFDGKFINLQRKNVEQ